MAILKFTVRKIDAIKPPDTGRAEYWDAHTKGFGLRVSAQGRKTWVVMYRHQGRLRRLTLGTYPALPLARARKKASERLSEVAEGRDPAGEKLAARKADTFGDLAEDYMRLYAIPQKRSWRKDREALDRDLLPRFGRRLAADITRREVIELLDDIKGRGAPILANRTHEIMRRIYNWGISREKVGVNPCRDIERPSPERSRERVLTDDELRLVWPAFEKESPHMAAMFKLRVLTAQRGGEVSHMRWEDVDQSSAWWTIPGEYSKNGKAHRVPLSPQALDVLNAVEHRDDGSPWVFPSPNGKGPITVIWKAARRVRARSGIDFVPHDLRRTSATRLTEMGFPRLVVSKILNHAEGGVTSVYDRHSYDTEKCAALQSWGRRVEEIISGRAAAAASNIVELPGARR